MTRRDLLSFVIDVQRFRPVATVVLAALLMLSCLGELAAGNLRPSPSWSDWPSASRFRAVLVWALTGMVLRYARMHARRLAESEPFGAVSSELTADPQLGAPSGRCSRR